MTMQNAQSIAPSFPPVANPQIDATEQQGTLRTGPTGRVHRGGVPWHKRLALTKAPSPTAHHVLLTIGSFVSDGQSDAWPSVATLASMTGRGSRVVQRALRELEGVGLISGEPVKGGTTRYRLTVATPVVHDTPTPVVHDTPTPVVHDTPPLSYTTPEGTKEGTSTRDVQVRSVSKLTETPHKGANKGQTKQQKMVIAICRKVGFCVTFDGMEEFDEYSSAKKQAQIDRLLRVEARHDRRVARDAAGKPAPDVKTPKKTRGKKKPPAGKPAPASKKPKKTKGKKQSPGANAPRPDPPPMTPELRAEIEAVERGRGWHRVAGKWMKLW